DKRLCLILAFCGVGIVASAKGISTGSRDLIGMLFMLTQSAVYAISLILLKKFSTAFSRLEMIFCQNIAAVLLFAPFLLINRPLPTYSQAGLSSTYALLIGLVAFIFFYSALKKFPAGQASLLAYIEVPAAIVYGSIFFGEPLTPQLCIGGSLIIGSALWLTLRRDKEKVANTQEEILGSD
ncbi:MAG TPA: DMT family transporter, partial [bacterium]|nr:DMT family transporter [bacterium]